MGRKAVRAPEDSRWLAKKQENIQRIARINALLIERGLTIRAWADSHGIHWALARDVINGKLAGLRGESARVKALLIQDFGASLFEDGEDGKNCER